ncbi:MAG: hypothetical protein J7518_14310 [Nocardioidaceae bacterium]|nr:hypothetical protein [Nocardioidaceae bacterium]
MCRPDHFEVSYSINPWMDLGVPVDRERAIAQWEEIRRVYLELGHQVETVEPAAGLPDMVFAANGGIVHGGRAMAAHFTHDERKAEGELYRRWFEQAGMTPAVTATNLNEGEGDFLYVGGRFLAGTGFRTSLAAHAEVAEFFGVPVTSLTLVDPRLYHLDTALTVLNDETIAYYPAAFDPASQEILRTLFPDAVIATEADAAVLGLNAVSDGYHVVLSAAATDLIAALRERGFHPIGVDTSELNKAGGSAKCCTLEIGR